MKTHFSRFPSTLRMVVISIAGLAPAAGLRAAPLQWDGDGVFPLGGAGTWDTANPEWFNGSTYNAWVNANNDDAIFNTTAGAVVVDAGGVTARSLQFDTTGYSLSGGTISLAGGTGVINVNLTAAQTATLTSSIGGTTGLTKTGNGILSLGAAESYAGNTTVSAGTVNINATNVFNTTGLLTISGGALVQMNAASANQTVTGLDGSGTLRWTVGATNNPRITLDVASGTVTFSGTFSTNQSGNQRVASLTKSGAGTQILSNGTAFGFDRTLLTLSGGTLQVSANNQLGYLQIAGSGGTLQLDGRNQTIDTWAANSTVTNSSATTSVLGSQFNNKDWSGNIGGNIRIKANTGHDTNLRGTNSFTGGVDLTTTGAFTITSSAQLPANQIDFSGGSLDFSASGISLASDRTYTVASGGGSFRYRSNSAGSAAIQGAINNSGTPGALNFVTHPSNSGASTFTLSGGGNFSGTTVIGGSSSAANVTLRPGAANGISTSTVINFGGGNSRTYSLDLNGFSQQVAGLQNTGTGTGLVQRVVTSSAAPGQVITVNNAADYSFSGILGDTGTNNNNFGLAKSGNGTLTLSGTSTYTGATTVSGGTLLINGNNGSASGAVAVTNGTIGGSGTIGGATTIGSTGIHAPGHNGVGPQSFSSSLAYVGGSIFSWDLSATPEDPLGNPVNQGSYDMVSVVGELSGEAEFKIVLGLNDFDDAFWDTGKSWDNIFTAGAGSDLLSTIFTSFGGTNVAADGVVDGQGQFSFAPNSNTLQWSAIPEPGIAALASGFCLISLLRRRRAQGVHAFCNSTETT